MNTAGISSPLEKKGMVPNRAYVVWLILKGRKVISIVQHVYSVKTFCFGGNIMTI